MERFSQAAPCWKSKRLSLEKEDVAFCSLEGFASAFPPPTVRRASRRSQYIPVASRREDKNERWQSRQPMLRSSVLE